jgi:hypothetical protein
VHKPRGADWAQLAQSYGAPAEKCSDSLYSSKCSTCSSKQHRHQQESDCPCAFMRDILLSAFYLRHLDDVIDPRRLDRPCKGSDMMLRTDAQYSSLN